MVSRADDLRLRELLTDRLGDEATDKLLERLPLTPAHEFATRGDVAEVRGEIQALRGEMRDEFGRLRGEFGKLEGQFGELRGEFGELRGELGGFEGRLGEFRGEFHELRGDFGLHAASVANMLRMQAWAYAGLLLTGIGVSTAVATAVAG